MTDFRGNMIEPNYGGFKGKIIEQFSDLPARMDDKMLYYRYRISRTKHQYYLWNRKRPNIFLIDPYDYFFLSNLRPGKTLIFGSAGHYLDDLIPNLTVAEVRKWEVIQKFWPDYKIVDHRNELAQYGPFDNLYVTYCRGDIWVTLKGLTEHLTAYANAMQPGGLIFYSTRDSMIYNWNRLKIDHHAMFHDWAKSLEKIGLYIIWENLGFPLREPDEHGKYDMRENPDQLNGNLKWIFQYQAQDAVINFDSLPSSIDKPLQIK